jgi:hypothetical protein
MKRKKMYRDCVKQSVAVVQQLRPPWSARCDTSPSTIYILQSAPQRAGIKRK